MYTTVTVTGTISRSTTGGWGFEGHGTATAHDCIPNDTDDHVLILRCRVGEIIATSPIEGSPVYELNVDASTEPIGANA